MKVKERFFLIPEYFLDSIVRRVSSRPAEERDIFFHEIVESYLNSKFISELTWNIEVRKIEDK